MANQQKTKKCNECGIRRPLEMFQRNSTVADGHRSKCKKCMGVEAPKPKEEIAPPKRFARPLDSEVYIITSAQNATDVDLAFFTTLKAAAKHLGAELVVVPFRYKNPTSVWSASQAAEDWWDPVLVPHLFNVRKKLNPNLVLCADIKTQPTATSPLTGFESLTGPESCIIGHPKMQFRTVPVPSGRYPKILSTTGACTKKNYTDTKAGKIGAFHHYLGAVIVEIQGKTFHLRQLNADRLDGSFIDLDTLYTAQGAKKAPPALGLVTGDTHARFIDPKVDKATYGPGGIVETLDPQTIVFHDVVDGDTVNPHQAGDPFMAEARRKADMASVEDEVKHVVKWVNSRAKGRQAVIVDSNHHDFLARWVLSTDWKRDVKNAGFYLETARAMLASARMTPGGAEYDDPFAYWAKKMLAPNIKMLGPDDSFKIGDAECALHGHNGPNGAKGSLKNLSRMGVKVNIGHVHSPGIEEGGYAAGTSTPLKLSYTRGSPGSWLNTHIATYANGKRALITIVDGAWRLNPQADEKAA